MDEGVNMTAENTFVSKKIQSFTWMNVTSGEYLFWINIALGKSRKLVR